MKYILTGLVFILSDSSVLCGININSEQRSAFPAEFIQQVSWFFPPVVTGLQCVHCNEREIFFWLPEALVTQVNLNRDLSHSLKWPLKLKAMWRQKPAEASQHTLIPLQQNDTFVSVNKKNCSKTISYFGNYGVKITHYNLLPAHTITPKFSPPKARQGKKVGNHLIHWSCSDD